MRRTKKLHGRERIRDKKVSLDLRFPSLSGHWHCLVLCLKCRCLGPTSDLLNQDLGALVLGIWIAKWLRSWLCCTALFQALLHACFPALCVLVGRAGSSSGPMGCYDAGHGALVPWVQSLAMAQLASTSQAGAFREGKRVRTSQQRGSHCILLAVLGVVASPMVSHWLLGLLWGLAENSKRIWPWAAWNGLFLFCCPLASWLWVVGSAFSLLWVSLQSAPQGSSLSASWWRMLFLQSSLLKWSLMMGKMLNWDGEISLGGTKKLQPVQVCPSVPWISLARYPDCLVE